MVFDRENEARRSCKRVVFKDKKKTYLDFYIRDTYLDVSMKKIAIISIDYNRDAMTHDFLESVKGLHHTKEFLITTIIVDNASKDVFSLTKEEKIGGNVVVLRNGVNTGFTGGNNTGIRYALENGFDYLVVLNNDTMLDPDLIKVLFEEAEKDSSIGLLVPKIYFAPGHEF